jgi:hypothetical protein
MTPTEPNAGRSITEPEDGRAAMVLEGLLIGIVSNRKADLGGCTERDKAQCGCSECLATAALGKLGDMVTERRALADRVRALEGLLGEAFPHIERMLSDHCGAMCCDPDQGGCWLRRARAALRSGAPSEEGTT